MRDPAGAPSRERLLALCDRFAGRPVLLLADLVADRFISGIPKRISREAPVLILAYDGESTTLGGGANAVANVRALGGAPLPVGLVGDDDSGQQILSALAERGIPTAGILVRGGYRTPTKTRVLAGGRHSIKQQIVRIDQEQRAELSPVERAALRRRIADYGGRTMVAVLSDYGYGVVDPALLDDVRAALAGPGGAAPTVLCDSRYRLADFAGLDGATPNEEEAEALLGGPLGDDDRVAGPRGESLRQRLGARFLLVTRGSRGMALFEAGGAIHIPVHGTDQVADVTGAGDTVIGTFALALAAGATALEAALLADYAGGIVVMKMGTATPSIDELRHAIEVDATPRERLRWAAS